MSKTRSFLRRRELVTRVHRRKGPEPDFADIPDLNVQPGEITEVAGNAYATSEGLMGLQPWNRLLGICVSDWKTRGLTTFQQVVAMND